jgi:uncharacterized protein (DUF1501 family)
MRRRDLLSLLPGLGLAGLLPRVARGAGATPEHKFLFVLAAGGWDTTAVFTPALDNPHVDTEPEAAVAQIGDLAFVDHPARPAVHGFFSRWGDQTCILNGLEVRSVTHEACERILLTGSPGSGGDDWPSLLAARSVQTLALPHLVVYGPAITSSYTNRVVRVGDNGQLLDLLDGSALSRSGLDPSALPGSADALVDAALAARVAEHANQRTASAARFGADYAQALRDLTALEGQAGSLDLASEGTGCGRDVANDAAVVFDAMEQGLTRCGMVEDAGWCDEGWDTHTGNAQQSVNFELLFGYLDRALQDLQGRVSPSGGALADEVTLVVLSEMGRHPVLNSAAGRDHWTFTSAMLVGAGVRGGQVIGAMDDDFLGRSVDLATGEVTDSGVGLVPGHLGATLLTLGGVDPAEVLAGGEQAITAALL